MTSLGCPNLITTSMVQSDDKNYPDKKLEDADQIVKEASELVKLLESRIAALQLSAQALKTPSERKMQAPPKNSYLNPKTEEAVNNPFRQTKKHKLVETSMPPRPPLHQSIRASYSCCQQSPNLLNLSPVITFPQQATSPAPSLSYTPSQIHHTSNRSQEQSSVKSYKLSSIPNQKQSSKPVLNVKNIVQRLESLNMSPNQNKLEKAHIRRRTPAGGAGSVASTSSGVNRPSKPSNTPSQSRAADFTRKVRNPKSKLISSHKIPPRQHSSNYSDDSSATIVGRRLNNPAANPSPKRATIPHPPHFQVRPNLMQLQSRSIQLRRQPHQLRVRVKVRHLEEDDSPDLGASIAVAVRIVRRRRFHG
ncbi:hypothetical protein QQ045_018214 [Rhodiola kirilowii]